MIRTAHFLGPKGAQNLPKGVKGARFGDCSLALSSCSLRQKIGRTPFTSSSLSCYIGAKLKGPVFETTIPVAVLTSTEKRGFVTSKILGLVRLAASSLMVTGGMSLSARLATCLQAWFQHPVHLMRLKPLTVGYFDSPVGIQSMTAINTASRCAVTPTTGTPDPIQLHADARNALSMAIFYLRQPQANVPGARRKAIQALSALRGLDLSLEG